MIALGRLIGLTVYEALGGVYPLPSFDLTLIGGCCRSDGCRIGAGGRDQRAPPHDLRADDGSGTARC